MCRQRLRPMRMPMSKWLVHLDGRGRRNPNPNLSNHIKHPNYRARISLYLPRPPHLSLNLRPPFPSLLRSSQSLTPHQNSPLVLYPKSPCLKNPNSLSNLLLLPLPPNLLQFLSRLSKPVPRKTSRRSTSLRKTLLSQ